MSGIRINVEEASNDGREDLVPDVSELYICNYCRALTSKSLPFIQPF